MNKIESTKENAPSLNVLILIIITHLNCLGNRIMSQQLCLSFNIILIVYFMSNLGCHTTRDTVIQTICHRIKNPRKDNKIGERNQI